MHATLRPVQFGSFHPHKTLTNIRFTLARRVCIIVSDDDVRDFRYSELKEWLLRKKYPVEVIHSGIEQARKLDRKAILCSTEGNDEQNTEQMSTIPFVFTNNCSNPEVLNTVRRGLDILTPSVRMQTVMKDKSVVAARRQPRNLKSILFKPRFDTRTDQGKGSVLPCKKDPNRKKTRGRPCKCCDLLEECTHIKFKGSNEPFEIRFHFTCDTRNVIYAITCQGCGDNYIGKTEREVRDRCGEYRIAIDNGKYTQGVHEHIAKCGGGRFVMTPFFKLHDNSRDSQTILSYETLFIQRYKPRLNILKL